MTWEYKVFTVDHFLSSNDDLNLEDKLNKYGEKGWELTGVLQKPSATLGNHDELQDDSIVFKKQN